MEKFLSRVYEISGMIAVSCIIGGGIYGIITLFV